MQIYTGRLKLSHILNYKNKNDDYDKPSNYDYFMNILSLNCDEMVTKLTSFCFYK